MASLQLCKNGGRSSTVAAQALDQRRGQRGGRVRRRLDGHHEAGRARRLRGHRADAGNRRPAIPDETADLVRAEERHEVAHRGAAREGDRVDGSRSEGCPEAVDVGIARQHRLVGHDLLHQRTARAPAARGKRKRRPRRSSPASASTRPSARYSAGTTSGRRWRRPSSAAVSGPIAASRTWASSRTSRPWVAKRSKNTRTPFGLVKTIQSYWNALATARSRAAGSRGGPMAMVGKTITSAPASIRSEEHTSELQSRTL